MHPQATHFIVSKDGILDRGSHFNSLRQTYGDKYYMYMYMDTLLSAAMISAYGYPWRLGPNIHWTSNYGTGIVLLEICCRGWVFNNFV